MNGQSYFSERSFAVKRTADAVIANSSYFGLNCIEHSYSEKNQKNIKDNFSDIQKISLNQAKNILYFFLFEIVVACVPFVFGYLFSYSFSLSNNIIGLVIGIIIFVLAYSIWNKKISRQWYRLSWLIKG